MNVLVLFASGELCNSLNERHIDIVIDEIKKGNHVVVLNCDESIGLCMFNPEKSKFYCRCCKYVAKRDFKRLMPEGIEQHWIKEYVNRIDKNKFKHFKYETAEELRNLEYRGVQIGFGVMSTYISQTRNLNPQITNESRRYFDALIEEQLVTLEVLEMLQDKYNFGLVVFQNGRGSQLKPYLNFCQNRKINFWCTEFIRNGNKVFTNNFWNDYAHSLKAVDDKYKDCWEKSPDPLETKEKIGRLFFENRRNAIASGDKIYVKDQIKGLMPKEWDKSKENIVIFNSSEDEFCAVGKEWDALKLFENQIAGISAICEHYKDDKTKHFTLRIHPNLNNLHYKYHTDLYRLNYPNLTVIPAWERISSYSLLDAADKIIVFGSTMGIEAAYWGKPVICLAAAFYVSFNICYAPKDRNALWSIIDNKNLVPLYSDRILSYGYYIMCNAHEKTKYIPVDYKSFKFLGKTLRVCEGKKILGSSLIYALVAGVLRLKLIKKIDAVFYKLPNEEE